jgi:hypothetical protein
MFRAMGSGGRFKTGVEILENELAEEKAGALGRAGRRVAKSLDALKAWTGGGEKRVDLVYDAADAVWCFFIQRESLGLRDQRPVIEHYAIPREVLVRLGARRPKVKA